RARRIHRRGLGGAPRLPRPEEARMRPGEARVAPSKWDRLAGALDTAGLLDRLLWLRARLGLRSLTVLTYHRVGTARGSELDPGVFEVEPAELEAQLAVLRTHCTVLSITDLRLIQRGRAAPPNAVMI